nr:hypothetical protein [Tanacetum cinerariifolium]
VDDQDRHIAHLEEENLILKDYLFLMVCEFDDLRMWLQRLKKQSRGIDRLNEEVVEKHFKSDTRSMTNDGKAKVVVKLGVYDNDVKKLKNELAKIRSCSAIQAML